VQAHRNAALVVVLAALNGGGVAVGLHQWDGDRDARSGASSSPDPGPTRTTDPRTTEPTPEPSPSPETSGTQESGTGGSGPEGWIGVDDPAGFGLSLPDASWQRSVYGVEGDLTQIDYTPDDGVHLLRIGIDKSPDFAHPKDHQLDLEQQLQGLEDYRRVELRETVYRDRPSARWEYTWTARASDDTAIHPGPRRAIEEMYIARDGTEYAIYMSGPAGDWDTTRQRFDAVLRSWRTQTG
jgi:hypothetical protein